jgi:carbonic anhydrase
MSRITTRRAVLRAIAGAVGTFPFAGAMNRAFGAATPPPQSERQWTFDGVTGPEHWNELAPEYAACQFGNEQSPIDLVDAVKVASAHALRIDYKPVTVQVVDEGWTLRLMLEKGCEKVVNGDAFGLESILLRHPSEHLLSGRALEMELQFIHHREGAAAIGAVFVRQGRRNELFDRVLANLPDPAAEKGPGFRVNPSDLLPPLPEDGETRPYYRYMGSLTTPPCTEGVIWTVFKTPIEASPKQIRELSSLFPANARPVNRLNRRYLLEYGN